MFAVRTLFLEDSRVEHDQFELTPGNEHAETVCSLFREFLANRPPEFQDRLAFLKKGDMELDWKAAAGGVALATLFSEGEPLLMGLLLAGIDVDAESGLLGAIQETVLSSLEPDDATRFLEGNTRPALLTILFPGSPELLPTVQLLSVSLASVFFRVILQLHREAQDND